MPNLYDIAPSLQGSKVFSKLDAASMFWQIPLHAESSTLTTFITPFGRFCFRRLPFGISSAPEIFQRLMTDLLQGKPGTNVIMDDILVHGKTMEEHDSNLERILDAVQLSGLNLNKSKCEFRKDEIGYFGHHVGKDSIKPDPQKVKAIMELASPNNVSELRRVLGMVNHLGKFLPDLSSVLQRSPLPIGKNGSDNQDDDDDVQLSLNRVESSRPVSEEKILQIEEATREDHALQEVIKLVLDGWPRYQTQIPLEARSFFAYRGELSYSEGKLLYRNQIVVPAALKKEGYLLR